MAPKVITMSNACYQVTALPGVEDGVLPAPDWRRVGKGLQAVWPYGDDLMKDLWWRVVDIYGSTAGWSDEDTARDRAAMLTWLNRYRSIMEPS